MKSRLEEIENKLQRRDRKRKKRDALTEAELKQQQSKDIELAKKKAAYIREQGLQRYKEQLMIELEHDKKKKLGVVLLLYLLAVALIGYMYYTNAELDVEKLLLELIKEV